MTEIHNYTELKNEIKRLEQSIELKKIQLRSDMTELKERMMPSRILSGTFNKLTGEPAGKNAKLLSMETLKAGLSLWMSGLLVKTEKKAESKVNEVIDKIFYKINSILSRNKKKLITEPPYFIESDKLNEEES